MKNPAAISLISSVGVTVALAWAQGSIAQAVPLVFQTTFDCPEWRQTIGLGDADVCGERDGISGYGGWTTRNGSAAQITAAANYPGGGGGKGVRHYRGDGTNNNDGGVAITLPSAVTEMWVRFYMRYSLGFAWLGGQPHYTKDNYWQGPESLIFGIQGGGARWGVHSKGKSHSSAQTWAQTMGGNTGDGKWYCYEYHVKQGGADGSLQIWIDGVQVLKQTSANLGSTGWQTVLIGSNQNKVVGAGNADHYTDYDDIAISTSGYVGCVVRASS